ncbi:MAG TPA: PQQ-dependent dehydrogenase, methanol/ethanol family [Vicinamibacterales bacterium]|nr:PQQ-dependent dehydrogenase, methanol/ethanol family [Vicinamibacterales bacterium]
MTKRGLTLLLVLLGAAGSLHGQVSFDRLVRAAQEPQNWLSYSGGYFSQRHSDLAQVTPENVKNLESAWIYQLSSLEPSSTRFEMTPLVVDGIMYIVQPPNDIIALDAVSGRPFWTYSYNPSLQARLCCGRVNRGLAIQGDRLFMGTIDGHMQAIDAKNGKLLWDKAVVRPEAGYSFSSAPLVVKDKVLMGPSGGEFGIRGFLAAFDVATGNEAWRFNLVPGPGEPGFHTWQGDSWKTGGAPIWLTGSYDPELNLTYWGVGNPGPGWNGDEREGDNLYTNSVVALDADTGKLKWHFQFSPHDEFDYDAVQIPVLVDGMWQGQPRKLMYFANRNGYFYVLDRATGQFLSGKPFVEVDWASGLDPKSGRPIRVPGKAPSAAPGTLIFPGNQGGTNWYSPSYSPRTGLFYIPTWANYSTLFVRDKAEYVEGRRFGGGAWRFPVPGIRSGQGGYSWAKPEEGYGAVRAIDPMTGALKWEYKMSDLTWAGILTTASNVLFSGGAEGHFYALDARTGALLWKTQLGAVIRSGPMTYAVNGKQHVTVAAGSALFSFKLRE